MAADEHRPFKIPLKIPGLILMAILPLSVYIMAMIGSFLNSGKALAPSAFALIALLSAKIIWLLVKRRNKAFTL